MPPRGMLTVAEARARALKKVAADQRDWAAFGGEDALLEIPLHPPTEREALVDQTAAIAWVRAWQAAGGDDSGGFSVNWGGDRKSVV